MQIPSLSNMLLFPTDNKCYRKLHEHPTGYQHSFIDKPKDGQYLLFLRNEFGQKRIATFR